MTSIQQQYLCPKKIVFVLTNGNSTIFFISFLTNSVVKKSFIHAHLDFYQQSLSEFTKQTLSCTIFLSSELLLEKHLQIFLMASLKQLLLVYALVDLSPSQATSVSLIFLTRR